MAHLCALGVEVIVAYDANVEAWREGSSNCSCTLGFGEERERFLQRKVDKLIRAGAVEL
jgi:hypothetical protein